MLKAHFGKFPYHEKMDFVFHDSTYFKCKMVTSDLKNPGTSGRTSIGFRLYRDHGEGYDRLDLGRSYTYSEFVAKVEELENNEIKRYSKMSLFENGDQLN